MKYLMTVNNSQKVNVKNNFSGAERWEVEIF